MNRPPIPPVRPATPQPRPAVAPVPCPHCGGVCSLQTVSWQWPDATLPPEEQVKATRRVILAFTCVQGHSFQRIIDQQSGQPALSVLTDATGVVLDLGKLEMEQRRLQAMATIIIPNGMKPQ